MTKSAERPIRLPLSVRLLRRLGRAGGGRATGALRVWLWWDALMVRNLRPVQPGGLLRYSVGRYRGGTRRLADGTQVRSGDRLVELHFDNATLLRLAGAETFSPFLAEQLGAEDLRVLAGRMSAGDLQDVRALHGVTRFWAAIRRQGFEREPLPHSWYNRLQRFYLNGLLAIYHPDGWRGLSRARALAWPVEVWLGRDQLLARYDTAGAPRVSA